MQTVGKMVPDETRSKIYRPEAQLRVQPKGVQNRLPGGSYSKLDEDTIRGTLRGRKDTSGVIFNRLIKSADH